MIPHYRAGTLRLLAQSTQARAMSLPDVPTYQEAGVKGLVLDQWLGVFLPAGAPPAIVAQLNAEIDKALADPGVRESFLQLGQDAVGGSEAHFSELVRADYDKYQRLSRELNIKAN